MTDSTPSSDQENGNPIPIETDPIAFRAMAKAHVSTPAIGLILCGTFSIFLTICVTIAVIQNPDGFVDFTNASGWENPEEADPEAEEKTREAMKYASDVGPRIWVFGLSMLGGLIAIAGGICMKRLKARKFAIFASIVVMIPTGPCCTLGIVFGIWAIMVMLREDVVSVFENG